MESKYLLFFSTIFRSVFGKMSTQFRPKKKLGLLHAVYLGSLQSTFVILSGPIRSWKLDKRLPMSRPLGRSLQPTHRLSRLVCKHNDDYVTFTVKFPPVRTGYRYYSVYIFWHVTLTKTWSIISLNKKHYFVSRFIWFLYLFVFNLRILSCYLFDLSCKNIYNQHKPDTSTLYRLINIDRQAYRVHLNY